MNTIRKLWEFYYLQYILHSGLYMLDPWERAVFTTLLVLFAVTASYTAYLFMPSHVVMLSYYIQRVLGYGDSVVIGHDFVNHETPVAT